MDTKSFDEQVAALRGKVEPKQFGGKKADSTPEQWAAALDYIAAMREKHRESHRASARRWKARNAGRNAEGFRQWSAANRGHRREYMRRYLREYVRGRREGDLDFRLLDRMRNRLATAVRRGTRRGSAVRDLGCSVADLKAHLERQFAPGMTWENWGKGAGAWQIDHVYPLAKADLTDRAQLLAVCNWRNLQPLWETDNIRKGDTVTPDAQALFDRLRAEFSATAAA